MFKEYIQTEDMINLKDHAPVWGHQIIMKTYCSKFHIQSEIPGEQHWPFLRQAHGQKCDNNI